jgi:hypothetical protein
MKKKLIVILATLVVVLGVTSCMFPRQRQYEKATQDLHKATGELQSALDELQKLEESLKQDLNDMTSPINTDQTTPSLAPSPQQPNNYSSPFRSGPMTPEQLAEDLELSRQMETAEDVQDDWDDLQKYFDDMPDLPDLK